MLRDSEARLTAGEIAGRFEVSRPAVSRHLRVLREAGLVRDETVGRQRFYALEPGPLHELAAWLAQFQTALPSTAAGWEHPFDALETEVHRARRDRTSGRTSGRTAKDQQPGRRKDSA